MTFVSIATALPGWRALFSNGTSLIVLAWGIAQNEGEPDTGPVALVWSEDRGRLVDPSTLDGFNGLGAPIPPKAPPPPIDMTPLEGLAEAFEPRAPKARLVGLQLPNYFAWYVNPANVIDVDQRQADNVTIVTTVDGRQREVLGTTEQVRDLLQA